MHNKKVRNFKQLVTFPGTRIPSAHRVHQGKQGYSGAWICSVHGMAKLFEKQLPEDMTAYQVSNYKLTSMRSSHSTGGEIKYHHHVR